MEIQPRKPSTTGDGRYFTGDVWVDGIGHGDADWKVRVTNVHFAPGARSVWHCHLAGQMIYVTEGSGYVQARGSDVVRVEPGDAVFTPADEWHWHGAAPDYFMSHISVTPVVPQDNPMHEHIWGEPVTDEEYHGHSHGHSHDT